MMWTTKLFHIVTLLYKTVFKLEKRLAYSI